MPLKKISRIIYRTRAIINRGLYILYPIFHCGLYCRAVSVTDKLCTKQGKNFWVQNPRFIIESGLKSKAGYNGACTVGEDISSEKIAPHCGSPADLIYDSVHLSRI